MMPRACSSMLQDVPWKLVSGKCLHFRDLLVQYAWGEVFAFTKNKKKKPYKHCTCFVEPFQILHVYMGMWVLNFNQKLPRILWHIHCMFLICVPANYHKLPWHNASQLLPLVMILYIHDTVGRVLIARFFWLWITSFSRSCNQLVRKHRRACIL